MVKTMGKIEDDLKTLKDEVEELKRILNQLSFNVVRIMGTLDKGVVPSSDPDAEGIVGSVSVDLGPIEDRIEKIEEAIIRNIGIAGVDIAKTQIEGGKLRKFEQLLKDFWARIKKLLGFASQQDLVNIVANDVWNNREKFNEKDFTQHVIRNMDVNPLGIKISNLGFPADPIPLSKTSAARGIIWVE